MKVEELLLLLRKKIRRRLFSPALVFIVLVPEAAFAQLAINNSITQVFCNVVGIMLGTTGKSIATMGIIGLGVGALFGKVSWNAAMLAVMSVGVVFGAASIVGELGGGPGFALIIGAPGDGGGGIGDGGGGAKGHGGKGSEGSGTASSNMCTTGTILSN